MSSVAQPRPSPGFSEAQLQVLHVLQSKSYPMSISDICFEWGQAIVGSPSANYILNATVKDLFTAGWIIKKSVNPTDKYALSPKAQVHFANESKSKMDAVELEQQQRFLGAFLDHKREREESFFKFSFIHREHFKVNLVKIAEKAGIDNKQCFRYLSTMDLDLEKVVAGDDGYTVCYFKTPDDSDRQNAFLEGFHKHRLERETSFQQEEYPHPDHFKLNPSKIAEHSKLDVKICLRYISTMHLDLLTTSMSNGRIVYWLRKPRVQKQRVQKPIQQVVVQKVVEPEVVASEIPPLEEKVEEEQEVVEQEQLLVQQELSIAIPEVNESVSTETEEIKVEESSDDSADECLTFESATNYCVNFIIQNHLDKKPAEKIRHFPGMVFNETVIRAALVMMGQGN